MKFPDKMLLALVLLAAFLVATGAASYAASGPGVKTQTPCVNDPCIHLTPAMSLQNIGGITFVAPASGTAVVTFHGIGQCVNQNMSTDDQHGVIDFVTQVVEGGGTPIGTGPGGLHFKARLTPRNSGFTDYSTPINLAATRAIKIKQGKHNFHNRLAISRMDTDVSCDLNNLTFTVMFFPS